MKQESGRSLIEILGVLAIAGIMSAGAIGVYNVIRNNQMRKIASMEMEQIVKNTKLLMEMRGDYTGLSVDYLISAGALKSNRAPIGGSDWSVKPTDDGKGFTINLTQLSKSECQYFIASTPTWATKLLVNGFDKDINTDCFSTNTNEISFVIE